MRERRPAKPPAGGRAGPLGFIFVLLLFVAVAAALFVLNPFAPAAGPLGIPSVVPARASLPAGTPSRALGPQRSLFLPLIYR